MWDLFQEIEMPLVYTLYDMEKAGIKADGGVKAVWEQLSGRIKELETTIYDLAGETFNINSPKRLNVIFCLKNSLLPYGRKRRPATRPRPTCWRNWHRRHRSCPIFWSTVSLQSSKSTYADGLAGYIAADGRITTSSIRRSRQRDASQHRPNLQNIPIRMELGRE